MEDNKKNAEFAEIEQIQQNKGQKIRRLAADILKLCFDSDMSTSEIDQSLRYVNLGIGKFSKLQDYDYFECFNHRYGR